MERERLRDREPAEDTYYDKAIRYREEILRRQMNGRIVIHGDELAYQLARQGRLKHYMSPAITDTALDNWSVFEQDIERHSGRHRHQGGILIYVIEGEGTTEVNGELLDWQADDLLLLPIRPEGVSHQHFNRNTSKRCRWIAFSNKIIKDYIFHFITQLAEAPFLTGKPLDIQEIVEKGNSHGDWKTRVADGQVSLVTHPDELASTNLFEKLLEMRDQMRARQAKATWLIRGKELPWELNAHGKMQWYLHPCIAYSVLQTHLFYRQDIPIGSQSGRQRHGGDKIFFILQGTGYTAIDGIRHNWKENDVVLLPLRSKGVVYQHVNTGKEAVTLIGVELNMIQMIGLDRQAGFEELQPCPEFNNK